MLQGTTFNESTYLKHIPYKQCCSSNLNLVIKTDMYIFRGRYLADNRSTSLGDDQQAFWPPPPPPQLRHWPTVPPGLPIAQPTPWTSTSLTSSTASVKQDSAADTSLKNPCYPNLHELSEQETRYCSLYLIDEILLSVYSILGQQIFALYTIRPIHYPQIKGCCSIAEGFNFLHIPLNKSQEVKSSVEE